jgi:hypothetical protein
MWSKEKTLEWLKLGSKGKYKKRKLKESKNKFWIANKEEKND